MLAPLNLKPIFQTSFTGQPFIKAATLQQTYRKVPAALVQYEIEREETPQAVGALLLKWKLLARDYRYILNSTPPKSHRGLATLFFALVDELRDCGQNGHKFGHMRSNNICPASSSGMNGSEAET
jgi:hypothetical protein